jgi:hypothetical protein
LIAGASDPDKHPRIVARSNSAKTPIIWNVARLDGWRYQGPQMLLQPLVKSGRCQPYLATSTLATIVKQREGQ